MDQGGSQQRCIFVKDRVCPFKSSQISTQVCKICIEAWKTEAAIKNQVLQSNTQSGIPQQMTHISTNIEDKRAALNKRIKELDELLVKDKIDPQEYIKLRKQYFNNMVNATPKQGLKIIEEAIEKTPPPPREVRIAIITKGILGKHVYTAPEGWKLPKSISDRVIKEIFKLAEKNPRGEVKLRSGDYKIVCIASEKNKLALMILDADEEFESYRREIERVQGLLRKEKDWKDAIKKIEF